MRKRRFRRIREIRAHVAVTGLLVDLIKRRARVCERLHKPGQPFRRLLCPGRRLMFTIAFARVFGLAACMHVEVVREGARRGQGYRVVRSTHELEPLLVERG